MTINISYRGVDSTPAIQAYVEEKMQSLDKFSPEIRLIDVEVGLLNQHHQKGKIFECRAVMQLNGDVVRIEKDAEDLYKAIDKVRDHLRVDLSNRKERLSEKMSDKTL